MNTFFKTFFICLIACVSLLMYKYFSNESYNTNLKVTPSNPVFSTQPEPKEIKKEQETQDVQNFIAKGETPNKTNEYTHNCYFYSSSGKLTKIERKLRSQPSVESVVSVLLKGPTILETKNGLYSEIPAGVDLINVTNTNKTVIVNLSSNFGNGGGSQSVKNRVHQLAKTVKAIEPNKSIYLHINGKEVEYLGGDGVYIEQPLN